MKNAQCVRCTKKFHEKDIYTIQQFQYRQEPDYQWSKEFLKDQVGEWDSLCEKCIKFYADLSDDAWKKQGKR